MRIFTRYILKEVLSHALIGAGVFTFVIFLRDLERILELVVRASAPLPSVAELFFFTIPTALTITIPMGQEVVPLPEGNKYLGFIFARGDSPEAVEAALRKSHHCLRFRKWRYRDSRVKPNTRLAFGFRICFTPSFWRLRTRTPG